LQDILKEKGYIDIVGPRPVIEQSFQDGYITDGKGWLLMLKSRNLTSHSYDEQTAEEIVYDIKNNFFILLTQLQQKLEKERA
jgi:nucleotidyltransferase substrate binding protein (TIGR01987 family)